MTAKETGPVMKIPVILGPTAVGKSDMALRLCERLGLELISCDSRQIYRFMDIGTAKPTPAQRQAVKHWMIDIVEPDQIFSCFQFADTALSLIREGAKTGRRFLICGGSGLYFNGLSKGIGPLVAPDMEFREIYREKLRMHGAKAIFDELTRVDPITAASSHPSNVQRNIRALEVYYLSAVPLSAQKQNARRPDGLDFFVVICTLPRALLYARINERVDLMIQSGLVEEFRMLLKKGFRETAPGMRCVGYRELFALENAGATLRQCADAIKMNTRHFAKRQITWLRHQIAGREFSMESPDFGAVQHMVESFMHGDN